MSGKGSNSVRVRHYNERVVLDAIRRLGQASKAEVARYAQLTPPAVAGIIDALEDAGYVAQFGKRFGGKGQPSVLYGLAAEGAYSIGLHVGRRALDAVLIDFVGVARAAESHEYDHPVPAVVEGLGNAVIARFKASLREEAGSRLVGLGIAAPYFLGAWEAELGFPAEVSLRWRELDLRTLFGEARDLPVFVENDASSAATAELVYGAGRRYRDFLHLSVNTLIGGGLILDGSLQTGPNGNAAALGPFPVTPSRLSTVPPPAGPFELLLNRASVYVLVDHLKARGVPVRRVRELEPLSDRTRPFFAEWLDDCADALAQAIIGALAVIDVEAIVIDGILPPERMAETIAAIERRCRELMPVGLVAPVIVAGSQGPQGAAAGAAILPIYTLFGPDSGVLTRRAREKKPLMVGSSGRPHG